jgi:Uncharacterized conserved protein
VIIESIVTTLREDGSVHIAPMGVRVQDGLPVLAPFRPSTTLENLRRERHAVINLTDDVRIFAGCLTGRRNWPTQPARIVPGAVLKQVLTHRELKVVREEDDTLRPRFFCRVMHEEVHSAFQGFNRAQTAVVEAAILVSRLPMLPAQKVDQEMAYLRIAIEKTAGPREQEAWDWLVARIEEFRKEAGERA